MGGCGSCSASSKPGQDHLHRLGDPVREEMSARLLGYVEAEKPLLRKVDGGGNPDIHSWGRAGGSDMVQWLDRSSG